MKYLSVFLAFILSILSASVATNYTDVNNDIQNISTLLTTLQNDVQYVESGIPGLSWALQVSQDAIAIDNMILQGIKDANASAAFGSNGSLDVGLSLIGLEPTIVKTLNSVAAKNASFGELGVIVLYSLTQLKEDTDSFASAVVAKLDILEQALAPAIVSSIDNAFDSAIAAYSDGNIPGFSLSERES